MTKEKLTVIAYGIAVAIVAELSPIAPVLLTVGGLVLVDTILGIWASLKRGEKFTSYGLSRLASKMAVYQIVIISIYFFETHLLGSLVPVMRVAAIMLATVEVKSLSENAGIILGMPVFKFIIEKISSKSTKFIDEKLTAQMGKELMNERGIVSKDQAGNGSTSREGV